MHSDCGYGQDGGRHMIVAARTMRSKDRITEQIGGNRILRLGSKSFAFEQILGLGSKSFAFEQILGLGSKSFTFEQNGSARIPKYV